VTKIYDKLVRDKIPAIIEEQGKTVHITKAEGISLTHYFDTKLKEELNEYYENGEVEEGIKSCAVSGAMKIFLTCPIPFIECLI